MLQLDRGQVGNREAFSNAARPSKIDLTRGLTSGGGAENRVPGMPRKRTVLLAWELGMGLAHARRLLAIAVSLKARGWSPVVAARELWACVDEYRAADIPMLPAPHHLGLGREAAQFKARSFADVLAASGYRGPRWLSPTVLGWDSLLDLVKPELIIADFSPMLMLAAYGRIPALAVGDGFVLPPPHLARMPVLRPEGTEMPTEPELLAHAAAVQAQRGRAVPQSLPSLVGGQAHVVCTFPETDLYAQFRLEPASGPIGGSPPPAKAPAQNGIFAYLAADFGPSAKLLQVLAASGPPLEAFVRDASDEMKSRLRALRVRVHDTPPRLSEVAERASLAVHHGGVGTIEAFVALGRPQLLLPRHFEQSLNAAGLVRLGVAMRLRPSFSVSEGAAIVAQAVASSALAERAGEVAGQLEKRPSRSLECVAAHSERLAAP